MQRDPCHTVKLVEQMQKPHRPRHRCAQAGFKPLDDIMFILDMEKPFKTVLEANFAKTPNERLRTKFEQFLITSNHQVSS